MARLNSSAEILSKKIELRWEDVPCPELGKDVEICVQALTGKELDEFQTLIVKNVRTGKIDTQDMSAKIIVIAAKKEPGGKRLFSKSDIETISEWPSSLTARLSNKVHELTGLDLETLKEKKENLSEGQSEDSISN